MSLLTSLLLLGELNEGRAGFKSQVCCFPDLYFLEMDVVNKKETNPAILAAKEDWAALIKLVTFH
jgi:hypothetical protein